MIMEGNVTGRVGTIGLSYKDKKKHLMIIPEVSATDRNPPNSKNWRNSQVEVTTQASDSQIMLAIVSVPGGYYFLLFIYIFLNIS